MTFALKKLQYGDKGELVKVWQEYLREEDVYHLAIDGHFGPGTLKATKEMEARQRLPQDGVVDDKLWGVALADGLSLIGSRWDLPEKPHFSPLTKSQREHIFGKIEYVPAPTPDNREAIRITNNWNGEYLTRVTIPQLRGVKGAPTDGSIFWHKKGVDQIKGFFDQVEREGKKKLIKTWSGSWAPRFIRNRPGTLSSHAWSSAFDINYWWNRLGRTPAPRGTEGSVIELVPIAHQWGLFWGGFFSRPDGMHFEIAVIM